MQVLVVGEVRVLVSDDLARAVYAYACALQYDEDRRASGALSRAISLWATGLTDGSQGLVHVLLTPATTVAYYNTGGSFDWESPAGTIARELQERLHEWLRYRSDLQAAMPEWDRRDIEDQATEYAEHTARAERGD